MASPGSADPIYKKSLPPISNCFCFLSPTSAVFKAPPDVTLMNLASSLSSIPATINPGVVDHERLIQKLKDYRLRLT